MSFLPYALAALLATCFIAGWLMLLTLPVLALSAAGVGGAVGGLTRVRELVPAWSRRVRRSILCIEGLAVLRLLSAA